MKFRKGDRVKIIGGDRKGQVGTIVVDARSGMPGVFLDIFDDGNHTCDSTIPRGHGWWVEKELLELFYKKGSLDDILYAPLRGEEIE